MKLLVIFYHLVPLRAGKVPLGGFRIAGNRESVTIREMRKGWESETDNGECLSG